MLKKKAQIKTKKTKEETAGRKLQDGDEIN